MSNWEIYHRPSCERPHAPIGYPGCTCMVVDAWKPITSCPKNGTPFLCGFWAKDYFWITKAHWAGGVVDGGWDGAREPIECVKVGYWMPLPPAPARETEVKP